MVVAGQREHAAMLRGAGGVGVLEHVHERSTPGPLPYQMREHAIDLGAGEQVDLLRAPDRRRREVLVDAGLEVDVVVLEVASSRAHSAWS